ncbi:hypothetical protein PHYBLDRAFT_157133 [Phycomyces blakesleeanus NRRL 1555(-)]|uniref:Uncharacterized protein n=1 Tax=Phycomyces blakesleeanus (strain ATCC 8743b / DSM 1359 / FGSC 10004 / NBRC 33097 / NRRL 1555) TaxID=763407 RepID=A0A162VBD4_PHYB8|nr:hypothetical protein PHYBLDRAFT_157133 [Phycomyces blakesleeanus NRRL 1555(-)]OAD81422.1 hypothetical protein PHYBLDRAFT_157133 [Phycomyces blakesleeanus NRRL 1555(-)]|eukprot:XP_018299462.1 hypothetical protein PHYBLDRAFT_157133 [Phycomyces blakesleeanus NRRL 1555(-)]
MCYGSYVFDTSLKSCTQYLRDKGYDIAFLRSVFSSRFLLSPDFDCIYHGSHHLTCALGICL